MITSSLWMAYATNRNCCGVVKLHLALILLPIQSRKGSMLNNLTWMIAHDFMIGLKKKIVCYAYYCFPWKAQEEWKRKRKTPSTSELTRYATHSTKPPGSTQIWVGYGCAAQSFDHPPITKPEKVQICNLFLNHLFLEGPLFNMFKPISTFYHVNWDA